MNIHSSGLATLVTTMTACTAVCSAPPLRHDPFARPLLTATVPKNVVAQGDAAVDTSTWNPNLIAVMVAGDHSLVNLEGTIVAIGQEVDGYRLVQVRDREAIFTRGKQRVVLKMEASTLRSNKDRAPE
jgi:hypothetical protein